MREGDKYSRDEHDDVQGAPAVAGLIAARVERVGEVTGGGNQPPRSRLSDRLPPAERADLPNPNDD
jgi:hypothetical protein